MQLEWSHWKGGDRRKYEKRRKDEGFLGVKKTEKSLLVVAEVYEKQRL